MRFKPFIVAALAAAFVALGAGQGFGQGQTTGSIRGQIVSSEGAAVPNAQVVVRNVATGFDRSVLSDQNGRYAVLLLPPGTYTVQAQSIGFAPATAEQVRVTIGEATPLDLDLATQAVAIQGITVTGSAARIDPTQGGVVQTITPEQVESLPTQGRDFTDLINLSPLVSPQPGVGTGGQFSIAGARTSGTNVQVDGVDANNAFFGENRGSSRTPFAFSLESIQELQLITNGFDVEYGNYVGGVVNAVTRGGTNDLRGGAFLFYRDEALTGDDFEGRSPEAFNVRQFGANVSGPILRDRLHFFVSADAQVKDQPIFAGSEFSDAQLQPLLTALAAQGVESPQQYFGQHEQAEDNLVLFGRIDWSISDAHRLTLRQNYSNFEQTNDRIAPEEALTHGGPFKDDTWSTVGELNSVFGQNAVNTLRVQWAMEDRPRDPNPLGYLPELEIDIEGDDLEFGGDAVIFRNLLEEDKLQIVDNFSYRVGSHTLKFGTNNAFVQTGNMFWLNGAGEFEFQPGNGRTGLENFIAGTPTRYLRSVRSCNVPLSPSAAGEAVLCTDPDVPFAEFSYFEWSVYGQDEWQVSDRLLLGAGLRYGGTTFQDEPDGLPELEEAFGVPTGIVPDFSGISPRAFFTYDFEGDEDAVLRGGAGLLVGRAPAVLAGNVFQTDRPLIQVDCRDAAIPEYDLEELLAGERGSNNPYACAGAARLGRPEFTLFSEDFGLPRTLKANLGYERVLPFQTRVALDFLYGRTWDNYRVQDLNLRDVQFRVAAEADRPVFVPVNRVNSNVGFGASTDRLANLDFDRVYFNVADAEARSYSIAAEIEQPVGESLQFGVSYAYTDAFDNGSFSCCTSFDGIDEPTAGDPNFIGEPGDELVGAWGPSDFEIRHAVVANFLYRGPWGINASGIWRSQSGNPWTPVVDGDINGDGLAFNDRVFISRELAFATPADAALFEEKLDEFECLAGQVGRIATRNSCHNPWFHSFDLRLSKEIQTVGGQSAELLVDVFNVLNGLNEDWGRYLGVFGSDTNLLEAESFNTTTNTFVYSVNEEFGEEQPVGFDPFQFQLQLGVRYRF